MSQEAYSTSRSQNSLSDSHTDRGGDWSTKDRLDRAEELPAQSRASGIALAGTHSWGDCPLQRILPRPLAPILNRALVSHVLDWLQRGNVRRVSICGNSLTQVIRKFLRGDCYHGAVPQGMQLDFYHDISPRGPAGCVKDAALNSDVDTYLAVEGTIFPPDGLSASDLIETHRRSGAALTVVVNDTSQANQDTVRPLENLARGDLLTPIGIYVFSQQALRYVSTAGYQDIKEALIPRLYQCGESVLTYRTTAMAPRVTGVESYLAVNEWALVHAVQNVLGNVEGKDFRSEYRKIDGAWVHRTATISSNGTRIVGPVLIGPGTVLERGVTIVGPTTIGSHSTIKEDAVVCRTAIWDSACVGPRAVLDRCIVTTDADVHAENSYRYGVLSAVRTKRSRRVVGKARAS